MTRHEARHRADDLLYTDALIWNRIVQGRGVIMRCHGHGDSSDDKPIRVERDGADVVTVTNVGVSI